MKKIFYSIILSLFAAVICFCSKHEEEFVRKTDLGVVSLSVSEARQYVESRLRTGTRSGNVANDNPLILGDFSMDWEQSESSVGDILYSLDIPVNSEYKYYSVGFDSLDNCLLTPMYHKMVVVKEGLTETLDAYLRFYIPDRGHALSHSESYYDALLNSDVKTEFTGMSVYSTLDGFPVAAGRYSDGVLEESAFLFDTLRPIAENAARLAKLLDGRLAARVRNVPAVSTRSEEFGWELDIDDVVVIGKPLSKKDEHCEFEDIWWPSFNDPLADDGGFGCGGGGGGRSSSAGDNGEDEKSSDDGKKYPKNPRIETDDPNVRQLLDSLLLDCMGALLVSTISEDVTIVAANDGQGGVCSVKGIMDRNGKWSGHNRYTIQINSYLDITLIEELIHVHQYQGKRSSAVHDYRLNLEIEAKLGWYLYRDRMNNVNSKEMEPYLGGRSGVGAFKGLGFLYPDNNVTNCEFYNMYMNAVSCLRSIPYTESAYPFSEEHMIFPTLDELMKDC